MARTEKVEIRVSPEEKKRLQVLAGEERVGTWMREQCLGGTRPSVASAEVAPQPKPAAGETEKTGGSDSVPQGSAPAVDPLEHLVPIRAKAHSRYAGPIAERMARADVKRGWRPG